MNSWSKNLELLIKSRTSIIWIKTKEEERLENLQKILDQQLQNKNEAIPTTATTISEKRLPFEPNSKK